LAVPVATADALAARRYGEEWLRLVLQPPWVPADIASRLTPVRRSPAGYDVLVAQYAVADCGFRIWDTSVALTVEISSPSLGDGVADWPAFVRSVLGRFFNGTGYQNELTGLDDFARCTVHRSGDMARVLLGYPLPAVRENNPKRYWEEGNPVYWKQRGQLIVRLSKLPDGEHPLHDEYGLKQRFPSVESQLASAAPGQLIQHILAADPQDPETLALNRLADRAIMNRPDRLSFVMPLLHSMDRAKGPYGRLMLLNAVDGVLRDGQDRQLLEAVKESLLALPAELQDPMVQPRVALLLKRVDDLLHPPAPEPDQGSAAGGEAGKPPLMR
jgi:hypothetical protein